MPWVNFHTHTSFCDGISHPEGYILQAIDLGMPAYGFSGHAPMPFATKWAIPSEQLHAYITTIHALKKKYATQIDLYTALEIDYIPNLTGVHVFNHLELDYTIGAVHFVGFFEDGKAFSVAGKAVDFDKGLHEIYDNSIQKLASTYFQLNCEMLEYDTPMVLAHADLIKNSISDDSVYQQKWYKNALFEMIDVACEKDVIIEINTRGWYKKRTSELYPSVEAIKYMQKKGVRMMLSADTHLLSELTAGFSEAATILHSLGVDEIAVYKGDGFQPVAFSAKGIAY
ncbi:MAG: histidinol-phosphatase [Paludibacteraceae bacterium]|nr:histidinol-phosphatase [Paludibacteraceae bacterium]MBP6284200.1 histidinol-phosphatase [Paludibacteraceae bacterium]